MSGFDRRQFLHMLGLGGMATLATPKGFGIPLFGGEGSPSGLWTPEGRSDLLAGHIVAYRPKPSIKVPPKAGPPHNDWDEWGNPINAGPQGTVVARIPKKLRTSPDCVLSSRFTVSRAAAMPDTVAEAHAEFYLLSRDVRAAFAAYTTEFLRHARAGDSLDGFGPPLVVVTVVDAAIEVERSGLVYAEGALDGLPPTVRDPGPRVKATPGIKDPVVAGIYDSFHRNGPWSPASDVVNVRDKVGDQVMAVCHYEQHIVRGVTEKDLSKYDLEPYSRQGEYPINVPTDIDIGALMRTDSQIIRDMSNAPRRDFVRSRFKRLLA